MHEVESYRPFCISYPADMRAVRGKRNIVPVLTTALDGSLRFRLGQVTGPVWISRKSIGASR